jgi:tripartite-type tricarboxylate transporter receptor subunit TctC
MRLPIRRVLGAAGAALCGLLFSAIAAAQAYPARAITFVYPYPPGSASDNAFRSIVQEASKRIGQPLVYENRSGAGGRIGLDAVLKAPADGYTIGMFNNVLGVSQPLIDPRLQIEPVKDYTPIVLAVESYLLMVIRSGEPYRDLKGLLDYAKGNPGKLNMSTPATGSGAHLVLALLTARTGVNIVNIPYKGTAPATQAILSGEVNLTLTDSTVKPFVDNGRLLAIATTGAQRWASFPNVQTFEEQGLKGVAYSSWSGVVGPPGMPRPVMDRLNRAFVEALGTAEVRGRLEVAGLAARGGTPEDLGALIKAELAQWRPVIAAAGIKADQ